MTPGSLVGGKYRLTRQIGEGAMGVVWAAVNELTSREVALKLILRSTDDLRHRLLREARACGSLSHRNIIEVLDVGQTDVGDPFLVMPLLSGETLADLLARQRRLDPTVAAQVARDVARALAAAHHASIIHRDLKPANIFMHQEAGTEGTIVKVLDFGVAKNLAAVDALATMVGGAVGSPAYMSPEQIRAERNIDHRSDIWSLGVVLFEMLTGVRPFQGDTQEVVQRVLTGEVPHVARFVRHVPEGLAEVVGRCLERNRDQRMGSSADLANLLHEYSGSNESSRVFTDREVRSSSVSQAPSEVARSSGPGRADSGYGASSSQTGGAPQGSAGDGATVPMHAGMLGGRERKPTVPGGYGAPGGQGGAGAPGAPGAYGQGAVGGAGARGGWQQGQGAAEPARDTMASAVAASGAAAARPFGATEPMRRPSPAAGMPAVPRVPPEEVSQDAQTAKLDPSHFAQWAAGSGGNAAAGAAGSSVSVASPLNTAIPVFMDESGAALMSEVGGGTIKVSPEMLPRVSPVSGAPEAGSVTSSTSPLLTHAGSSGWRGGSQEGVSPRARIGIFVAAAGVSVMVASTLLYVVISAMSGPEAATAPAGPEGKAAATAAAVATGAPTGAASTGAQAAEAGAVARMAKVLAASASSAAKAAEAPPPASGEVAPQAATTATGGPGGSHKSPPVATAPPTVVKPAPTPVKTPVTTSRPPIKPTPLRKCTILIKTNCTR